MQSKLVEKLFLDLKEEVKSQNIKSVERFLKVNIWFLFILFGIPETQIKVQKKHAVSIFLILIYLRSTKGSSVGAFDVLTSTNPNMTLFTNDQSQLLCPLFVLKCRQQDNKSSKLTKKPTPCSENCNNKR